MKKRNIIIISIIVLLVLIIILWSNGIIPRQIAKVYGTIYMKYNFPKMNLEYNDIEWSKYHNDYIIYFKDKNEQRYSCVIGPKYFPVSIGQGIVAIEEIYRENY